MVGTLLRVGMGIIAGILILAIVLAIPFVPFILLTVFLGIDRSVGYVFESVMAGLLLLFLYFRYTLEIIGFVDELRERLSWCCHQHDWDGCRCRTRGCQSRRPSHCNWDGCTCRKCKVTRNAEHDWDGCICRKCNPMSIQRTIGWRDRGHAWDQCVCLKCREKREHRWDGDVCGTCAGVRCLECFGSGCYNCTTCCGQGSLPENEWDGLSPMVTCGDCSGGKATCSKCQGSGVLRQEWITSPVQSENRDK